MNCREIYTALSREYPESLRCSWDNDGIMVSSSGREITSALTAIDVTPDALREAKRLGCQLILSHHPLIFHPLGNLDYTAAHSSLIIELIKSDIAVISLHTRFDLARGGLNDGLCRRLGFEPVGYFGTEEDDFSLGRIITPSSPLSARELAGIASEKLNTTVRLFDAGKMIESFGCVSGSGKGYILPALSAGLGALITGDITHDAAVCALENGFSIIDAGHFATEAISAQLLALNLRSLGLEVHEYIPEIAPEFVHIAP